MKRIFLRLALVFIITAISFSAASCADKSDTYSLTILSTNDIHGNFSVMPEFAAMVQQIRSENKNVLLLDGGDLFKGGAFNNYCGKIEAEIENAMGYNALVLGNNDFILPNNNNSTIEQSNTVIGNLSKWANYPLLCGNVKYKDSGKYIEGTQPYEVVTVNGVKIGIIGITTLDPKNRKAKYTESEDFISGETAVAQLLPEVKEKSDIQIVLSHAGMDINRKITGVSAIVSGHDHIALQKPEDPNKIPIIQAGSTNDQYLGRLDLTFKLKDGKWVLTKYTGKLLKSDGSKKDENIQKIIDGYKALPIPVLPL